MGEVEVLIIPSSPGVQISCVSNGPGAAGRSEHSSALMGTAMQPTEVLWLLFLPKVPSR